MRIFRVYATHLVGELLADVAQRAAGRGSEAANLGHGRGAQLEGGRGALKGRGTGECSEAQGEHEAGHGAAEGGAEVVGVTSQARESNTTCLQRT